LCRRTVIQASHLAFKNKKGSLRAAVWGRYDRRRRTAAATAAGRAGHSVGQSVGRGG